MDGILLSLCIKHEPSFGSYRVCYCCCCCWTWNIAWKYSYVFSSSFPFSDVAIAPWWCYFHSAFFFFSCHSFHGKHIQTWLECELWNIEELEWYAWHFGIMVLNLFALVMCNSSFSTIWVMCNCCAWNDDDDGNGLIYSAQTLSTFFYHRLEQLIHFALMCIFTRLPFTFLVHCLSLVLGSRSSR